MAVGFGAALTGGLNGLAGLGGLSGLFGGGGTELWRESAVPIMEMYNRGQGRAFEQLKHVGPAAFRARDSLMPWGQDALQRLQGNQFLGGLRNIANNPMAGFNEQANVLQKRINNQSNRLMGMAERDGISAGQGFGSRTAVQKGLIGQGALDASQAGMAQLLGQSYDRSLQAGTAGGGLLAQGLLGGLGQMESLYQMQLDPFQASWMPLEKLKGLVGNGITLANEQGGLF